MDNYQNLQDSVSSPSRSVIAVIPADGQNLPVVPKALFIGTGGDISIRCVDDQAPVIFRNVISGTILPVRPVEILSTNTTVADVVLLA